MTLKSLAATAAIGVAVSGSANTADNAAVAARCRQYAEDSWAHVSASLHAYNIAKDDALGLLAGQRYIFAQQHQTFVSCMRANGVNPSAW